MGMGNTMVEFFSEEMVARVWRYLSWRAAGLSEMMSLASFRALLAFCSPSAAITWGEVSVSSLVLRTGSYLSSGLSGSLSFSSHGSLQTLRKPDVLHLNSLDLNNKKIKISLTKVKTQNLRQFPMDQSRCQSGPLSPWQWHLSRRVFRTTSWFPARSLGDNIRWQNMRYFIFQWIKLSPSPPRQWLKSGRLLGDSKTSRYKTHQNCPLLFCIYCTVICNM